MPKNYLDLSGLSSFKEKIISYIDKCIASVKSWTEENFATKDESGNVTVDGEIQADNVPYTISETIILEIPASTIQEMLNNGITKLTIDAFTVNTDLICYANYGGLEYPSITVEDNYIEFFISNPYVNEGFACVLNNGVDADGNIDETKATFIIRVVDTENVTDLVVTQMEISYIDSKYFEHDFSIINSLSMNRRGAIGTYSTALGSSSKATGHSSFAAGLASEATGADSFAVGKGSFATGEAAASFGLMTTAGGKYSVAEGRYSNASAQGAHAEGNYTIASSANQHVQGKYNVEDSANKYAHIVGNGTSNNLRSNAHTLDWTGNAEFAGDVIAYGCSGESPIKLSDISGRLDYLNDLVEEGSESITYEELDSLFE